MKTRLNYLAVYRLPVVLVMLIVCACANKTDINDKVTVDGIIERMTLDEKLNMIGGNNHFETYPFPKLGIPALAMANGPSGVRPWKTPTYVYGLVDEYFKSTTYPSSIAMAASWDQDLLKEIGKAIGQEARGKEIDIVLGPTVNIVKNPFGGRNFESYGEDPFLSSEMAIPFIKGVQSQGVMTSIKHYVANDQEFNRFQVNNEISERALHEIYLTPFRRAIQEANPATVMSAYPKVNGEFCSHSGYLLDTVLRKQFGFKGFVMTDWWANHDGIASAKVGLDIEMPFAKYMNPKTVEDGLRKGHLNIDMVDRKVRNILNTMDEFGLLDGSRVEVQAVNNNRNHDLAVEMVEKSIVMLKNEGNLLPLNPRKLKKVTVIGPSGVIPRLGGGGSSTIPPRKWEAPLANIMEYLPEKKVRYSKGFEMEDDILPHAPDMIFNKELGKKGFKGQYFTNANLSGEPALVRYDSIIGFDWSKSSPGDEFKPETFSIRWSSILKIEEEETYQIKTLAWDKDVLRVLLDGKVVSEYNVMNGESGVNEHELANGAVYSQRIKLKKGEYKLVIEYQHDESAKNYVGKAAAVFEIEPYKTQEELKNEALKVAIDSDVVLFFAGISNQYESEGHDLKKIEIPENQKQLIREIAKANKRIIVILNNGTSLLMEDWIEDVPGVLEAWYPGQASEGIASILFGKLSPSGKLPFTVHKKWEDMEISKTYPPKDSSTLVYNDDIYVGYRYYDTFNKDPLFPFGFGLSYTEFEYSDLVLETKELDEGADVRISFKVSNVGDFDGREIAQVYIEDKESSLSRPKKELKGFKSISLKKGETKQVTMSINPKDLAFYDDGKKAWVVEPGSFMLYVGASSRDIRLKDGFSYKP